MTPGPVLAAMGAGVLASVVLRQQALRGSGWYLPRPPGGGDRSARAFERMQKEEAMWRTLDDHHRQRRERKDA